MLFAMESALLVQWRPRYSEPLRLIMTEKMKKDRDDDWSNIGVGEVQCLLRKDEGWNQKVRVSFGVGSR